MLCIAERGNVNQHDKVTHISIASDRQVKQGDTWTTRTNWNTVTTFSDQMRKRIANPKIGKKGNLVIVEGTIQSSSYEKNGTTIYKTDLIVQDFDILSFAQDRADDSTCD